MLQAAMNEFLMIQVLCPAGSRLGELTKLGAVKPFESDAKKMIGVFARQLMRELRTRDFPELVVLAHWLRPKALESLQAQFEAGLPIGTVALGRGMALHFAPGNVDTIFLYSALLSVLAGNVTVARVSSRSSPQMELLLRVLNSVLTEPHWDGVASRIRVIRYGRNAEVTDALSLACDLRIIWGGDESVRGIRSSPLRPRARDVTFADRWSLSVLDAVSILNAGPQLKEVARRFSNDAFWFGQMGCSSPRIVIWRGTVVQAENAADLFWTAVREEAHRFLDSVKPIQYVDKLVAQCDAAIAGSIKTIRTTGSNLVSVSQLSVKRLPSSKLMHVGGGMFWEMQIGELDEITPLLDSGSQTIGTFGITNKEWEEWTISNCARIDRIVPLGQSLQFDTIWDGMDLLREFTRLVAIRC